MDHQENDYGGAFTRLCGIVERLRGEGGCPWDREQSPRSLRGGLIEETYECVEAINENDPPHIREELGDLFLLVTMISYMHQQEGLFSIPSVLNGIAEKLIRRHPHVFAPGGTGGTLSSGEVLDRWARIKVEQEGRKPKDSVLDGVSRALPPLDRAWELQKKAARAGFDWPDAAGALAKLKEELRETEEELDKPGPDKGEERLEAELGDLLFSAINLCRLVGVEPSVALGRANATFTARFTYVERKMKESGAAMEAGSLPLMDRFWNEAKKA